MEYQKGDRVVVFYANDGQEELRGEVQSVTGTSADIDLVLIKTDQGMHVTRHASFVRHESIVDRRFRDGDLVVVHVPGTFARSGNYTEDAVKVPGQVSVRLENGVIQHFPAEYVKTIEATLTQIDPNRTVEIAYSEYETLLDRAKLYDRMHEFVEARTRTFERKLQTKNERLHESRIALKEALEQVKTLSVNLDRAIHSNQAQAAEINRLVKILQDNGLDPSLHASKPIDWTRVGG